MLRPLLLLYCAIVAILADSQCPNGYQVMGDGRCIRAPFVMQFERMEDMMVKGVDECKKDGAIFPIIRSNQENTMFNDIVASFTDVSSGPWLILGAECNIKTDRLEWEDGSQITYTNGGGVDLSFNCRTEDYHLASYVKNNYWETLAPTTSHYWMVLCVAEPKECGDYEPIADPKDETKPCFKIHTDPLNWKDAQEKCSDDFASLAAISSEQENKFFWRSAISQSAVDGMHIGAYQSTAGDSWRWIDDDSVISDYNNFVEAFPNPGVGNCSRMLSESSTAKWINEDCENQKLPFVCRRYGFSTLPKECPNGSPKAGKDIIAPGFPIPTIPCEYMLAVDANNVVQLEILALEANPNLDYLEIYEGQNLLANLTGTNPSPSSYMTKSSNVMRVNWKPSVDNRPQEYRGFRIRYKAIATGK